jgi:hypothetical protein
MENRRRKVVRETEFEEQVADIIRDCEIADEFLHAAEVLLTELPEEGVLVDETARIYVLVLPPFEGKGLKLYYTFNEETVLFMYLVAFD